MSLLFYDDSPVFGGHEVMALAGLEAILQRSSETLLFFASHSNEKLLTRLGEISSRFPHLKLIQLPWESSRFESLRNRFLPSRIHKLAELLRTHNPSLLVAIQGNIEHSSLSLHAAKQIGLRSVSYIPVPHTNEQMGAKLGKWRDIFCHRLFTLPDAFITITDEMGKMLKLRGATSTIHIVYNGIDTTRFLSGDKNEARKQLALPLEKHLLGIVGRIEFRQKQQHLLIEAIASEKNLAAACHLVFAGDGPDAQALSALIRSHQLSATILPWCDPAPLYRALDALVIPSRYEGLPLVMLEALASGTAVFGSDRDGMKDVLPSSMRFQPDCPKSLADALSKWFNAKSPPPAVDLVHRVRNTMSLTAFGQSFHDTVQRLRP